MCSDILGYVVCGRALCCFFSPGLIFVRYGPHQRYVPHELYVPHERYGTVVRTVGIYRPIWTAPCRFRPVVFTVIPGQYRRVIGKMTVLAITA